MTKNRLRIGDFMGLAILLGALSTFSTLMASGNQTKEYTAKVLRLEGAVGTWDQGKLTFSGDEVVFESSSGKEHEEWSYSHLRKIDVAKPRLLEITFLSGERVEFTPFGSETFDLGLVQFLRNNVNAPVQIKDEL
jgi:hypothetical protein